MNHPEWETTNERNRRFAESVRRKFNCGCIFREEKFCDLSPYGKCLVSVFELTTKPPQYPDARQCIVWDGEGFEPKSDNEVVIVFDVQVISDPGDLAMNSVWAWLSDSLIKDRDIYFKSDSWTKKQLHNEQVEFFDHSCGYRLGKFFVRERADGMIAIRIVEEANMIVGGRNELINTSFCLVKPQAEKIEPPASGVEYFTLHL